MQKFVAIILLIGLVFPLATAQKMSESKINAMRVAYITKVLNLSPEESKLFWPIHNEFNEKLRELGKKMSTKHIDLDIREDVALDKLKELQKNRAAEVALKSEYDAELLKIFSPIKVLKLYNAEMEFRREMFRDMRKRYKQRGSDSKNNKE